MFRTCPGPPLRTSEDARLESSAVSERRSALGPSAGRMRGKLTLRECEGGSRGGFAARSVSFHPARKSAPDALARGVGGIASSVSEHAFG